MLSKNHEVYELNVSPHLDDRIASNYTEKGEESLCFKWLKFMQSNQKQKTRVNYSHDLSLAMQQQQHTIPCSPSKACYVSMAC